MKIFTPDDVVIGALRARAAGKRPTEFLESIEKLGQDELCRLSEVALSQLPLEMNTWDKETLQEAGVIFVDPVAEDPLFQHVVLPKGWRIVPTNDARHSDLVDDAGVKRASIWYKAAMYDRCASLSIERAERK